MWSCFIYCSVYHIFLTFDLTYLLCKGGFVLIHSSKTNLIHDIRSEGKLVYINLTIRRYRCPDCSYVFPDEFTFLAKNSHITDRLKQEFVDRCIKGETFTYIGNDYSIDHKTVAAAFKAYSDSHAELLTYDYTPEVLGLDETYIDDHLRLVLLYLLLRRIFRDAYFVPEQSLVTIRNNFF